MSDARERLVEVTNYWMNRCLDAVGERDALREERDEAMALLREATRCVLTGGAKRCGRCLGCRADALLARMEGSDK